MPLTCGYVIRGGIRDGRRPLCVRGRRVSGSARSTDRRRLAHGRPRSGPGTGAEKATDGGGRSGHADRSYPDSGSDLPFQDACSMLSSSSSPGSSSASPVPRASAMRWLAASDRPSMQWASIFSRIATPRPTRRSAPPGLRQVRVGGQEDLLTDIALDISTAGQEPVQRGAASTRRPRAARAVSGGRRGYPPSAGPLFMTMRRASRA